MSGCAAIDDLKASLSRWFDTARFPDEGVGLPGDARDASFGCAGENPKGVPKAPKKKSRRRLNYSLRKPLCLPPKNSADCQNPPGRQGRTKPMGSLRRPLLCDCALSILKRHRPKYFTLRSAKNSERKTHFFVGVQGGGVEEQQVLRTPVRAMVARKVKLGDRDLFPSFAALAIVGRGERTAGFACVVQHSRSGVLNSSRVSAKAGIGFAALPPHG